MSSKTFFFNMTELNNLLNPQMRKIGLSGDTWEEAARFMIKKKFATLVSKLDANKNHIGYEVNWLEPQEQDKAAFQLPNDIYNAFQTMEFDDEFIEEWIREFRETIRKS